MGKLDNIKIIRMPFEPDENALSEPARRKRLVSVLAGIYESIFKEELKKTEQAGGNGKQTA